jgi:hypothetical protein
LGNDLDFNSDGKVDVFLNNGDRTFSFETFQFAEIIGSFCTDAVWVGDINFVMRTMSNRSPRI